MNILGIFHSYSDPSAALVCDGEVVAFVEEERLLRFKHACGYFPSRSIEFVLKSGGLTISDIDYIAQAWDCNAYDSGEMAAHYDKINSQYPTNEGDIAYQKKHLANLSSANQTGIILQNLRKIFGEIDFPPIVFTQHHLAHACMAYFHSGIDEALVLTIDGSGENVTTSWWKTGNNKLDLLHEIKIPHSLGWFFSAFTEYLGFRAYDGEYKVMGLAAYGKDDMELREKISKIIYYDGKGGFESDPMLLSRGKRSHSYYYPDSLIEFIGRPPRSSHEEITKWHINLAYEIQRRLEEIVKQMLQYWVDKTGISNLVIAGGVGLNVKMNGKLITSGIIDDFFIHPLCADNGVSIGAAFAHQYQNGGMKTKRLKQISWGPSYSDEEIEKVLKACKLQYIKQESIAGTVAKLLSQGKIVGWFQGRMESGPRALGNRSILADSRFVESRDKVNSVIKFREFWRPFCPSMTQEASERYLAKTIDAPFMVIALPTKDEANQEIPAVVHVDGSSRPQIVEAESNQCYYNMIKEFEKITGIPCVLNTSFNIKGEPIVCTPHDAIRTFSATGLDALAIGSFLLVKTEQ